MKKRAMYIVLGMIIFMCLGTIYSWSVFRKPLEGLFDITSTQSGLPYMIFLAVYALSMPIGGMIIEKLGPKLTVILGGVAVSLGWILSSFASGITAIAITYGVIGGFGIGLAYGAPLSVAAKWFPEKKGFALGLTLLGFGFSPFVTAPFSRYLIANYGPLSSFRILGFLFLAVITILALPLRFPKKGEVTTDSTQNQNDGQDISLKGMFKTKQFYGLWLCMTIGTFAGLTAIAITSPLAQEVIKLDAKTAAFMVSLFAIFNGVGRPVFGILTDKIGVAASAVVSYLLIICASIIILFTGEGTVVRYVIAFALFWMILGGWLAIAPTATTNLFGAKHYSRNYGVVFTAYGCGAILGVLLSGTIKDMFGSYLNTFYPTIALGILGIVIALLTLKRTPFVNSQS